MYNFSTISTIENILPAWQELHASNADNQSRIQTSSFVSPQVQKVWVDTFFQYENENHQAEIFVLTGYKADRLVLLVPLIIRQKNGIKSIRFMGDPVCQYGEFLVADLHEEEQSVVIQQALQYLVQQKKGDIIVLSAIQNKLLAVSCKNQKFILTQQQKAAILDLTQVKTLDDYWKSRSKSGFKQRNRLRRKLDREEGKLQTLYIEGNNAAAGKWVKALYNMKANQLLEKNQLSNSFSNPALKNFLENVVTRNAGTPLITVLLVKDKPIAIELGFIRGSTYYSFMGAFDNAFRHYRPGHLQLEDTVTYLFAKGVKIIDLLPPLMDYKARWSNKTQIAEDHVLPLTIKGKLYSRLVLSNLRPMAKKFQEQFLPQLRGLFKSATRS